ncbi:C39 family peptidase [Bulleidia extructa]|uniref:C39 family peptidase n=1 Tax=Bulleidia extructa TaxID=118748 RepID=UPI0023563028|nr:C39 family peptidase [Bulleidia extructa]
MKKIIKVAVITLMVIGFIKPVCAEEMNGFGNPPEWVEKENESRNREKEREAKNQVSTKSSHIVEQKFLSVPVFRQETKYWCGPASVQMIVKYKTGKKVSQSTLASYMNTNKSGTYVYQIARGLNKYTSSNFYGYKTVYQKGIYEATKESVNKNYPIVGNVMTKALNSAYKFNSGHYVVITGYRYRVQGTPASKSADYLRANGENKSLYYNDPYFASHDSVGAYKMTEAIKACTGYYIW